MKVKGPLGLFEKKSSKLEVLKIFMVKGAFDRNKTLEYFTKNTKLRNIVQQKYTGLV